MIRPTKTIELAHRADFVCSAISNLLAVVVAKSGDVSLCDLRSDRGSQPVPSRRFTGPDSDEVRVRSVSAHPTMDMLAVIDEQFGRLRIVDLIGNTKSERNPPPVRENGDFPTYVGFDGCQFDASGEFLWTAAHVSRTEIVIQARCIRDWFVVATGILPDNFGDPGCFFDGVGPPGKAAFWIGREGFSELFWLRRSGDKIDVEKESRLSIPGPVEFSPAGNQCLIHDEVVTALCRAEPASLRPVDRCDTLLEGVAIGAPAIYLNSDLALVCGYPRRLVLFDVKAMRAIKEIIVEGHEPRLRQWPTLVDGEKKELWTDIGTFMRIGANVVLVYYPDYHSPLLSDHSGIMTIPIASLIS